MRRKFILIIAFFLLIFSLLVIPPKPTHAIGLDFDLNIPGFTCGIADSKDDSNRCCISFFSIKADLKFNLPIIGSAINHITSPIENFINGISENNKKKFAKFGKTYFAEKGLCSSDGIVDWPDSGDANTCRCKLNTSRFFTTSEDVADRLCVYIKDDKERDQCRSCVIGENPAKGQGVWTGLGCVYSDFKLFIEQNILRSALGLAGIIAVLCIIYSAILLQTSQGNPEKIQQARDRATSCIMGLLVIIFSVFILKLIGVDILRIPGFGG